MCYDRLVDRQPDSVSLGSAAKVVVPDVSSSVEIGVERVTTRPTTKLRLRGPVRLLGVAATVALLASVARINVHDVYASERALVGQKILQPLESPTVHATALLLAALRPGTDVGEIFERYGVTLLNGVYDTSGDDVIAILAETIYPTAKLLQVALCRAGAFRLKGPAEPEILLFDLTPATPTKELSFAGNSRTHYAKVDSYDPAGWGNGFGLSSHCDMQPEATLAISEEIDRALLPVKSCTVDFWYDKPQPDPTADRGQTCLAAVKPDLGATHVIANGTALGPRHRYLLTLALKSAGRSQCLGSAHTDRAHQLRLKPCSCALGSIGVVVQFDTVDTMARPASSAYTVERFRVALHRLLKSGALRFVRAETESYGNGCHAHIVARETYMSKRNNMSERRIPLSPEGDSLLRGN